MTPPISNTTPAARDKREWLAIAATIRAVLAYIALAPRREEESVASFESRVVASQLPTTRIAVPSREGYTVGYNASLETFILYNADGRLIDSSQSGIAIAYRLGTGDSATSDAFARQLLELRDLAPSVAFDKPAFWCLGQPGEVTRFDAIARSLDDLCTVSRETGIVHVTPLYAGEIQHIDAGNDV